jgi:hypothetical protein
MSSGTIVAIVVVVIVVIALLAFAPAALRRRRLQQRFGPEYDRAVADAGSRREAESELAEREKRVRSLDIRPLDTPALDRYIRQWNALQEQFVDAPAKSVMSAQALVTAVMKDCGYPTEDVGQIMADLSVDHAGTLESYRQAQELSGRVSSGNAGTEDLRQAMVHYRSLFRDLLGDPAGIGTTAANAAADQATPADDGVTPPASTQPADSAAEDAGTDGPQAPSPASAASASQER